MIREYAQEGVTFEVEVRDFPGDRLIEMRVTPTKIEGRPAQGTHYDHMAMTLRMPRERWKRGLGLDKK